MSIPNTLYPPTVPEIIREFEPKKAKKLNDQSQMEYRGLVA
ncbi:hypothetical protein [Alkaliphilus hydrothermalis]|nr:hypothetical protein [Alkaliphilus hydrothermalis]